MGGGGGLGEEAGAEGGGVFLQGFGGACVLINLSGGGLGGGFTLLGDGAVLLAALANGFSISLFKRYAEGEDTLTLCGYQFIVGGGLLLLTGLCFSGTLLHFTGGSLLLLGYMVLLSAVAQTIWSALTRYNPVGRVAVYGFLNPVFGVLLSALLLREGQQAFTPYGFSCCIFCFAVAFIFFFRGILLRGAKLRTNSEKTIRTEKRRSPGCGLRRYGAG